MDKHTISSLRFTDYRVDYINYKYNYDFKEISSEDGLPIKMDIDIKHKIHRPKGQITLIVKIFEDVDNNPFKLIVSVTGDFYVAGEDVSDEKFVRYIELNGTAILFPFIRSIIADITRTANIPPLIIPTFNINKILERKRKLTLDSSGSID